MKITLGPDKRWYKPCPSCNKMQSYLRKNYAEESLRLGKVCKACSNSKVDNSHRGWHRGIRVSWFNKFKTGAELRAIEWTLTLDEIADIYEKQNRKCALTDDDIAFPEVGHPQKANASIDRIDSTKGYCYNNVQLVTRHVNMMKQSYDQEYFVNTCIAVARKFEKVNKGN